MTSDRHDELAVITLLLLLIARFGAVSTNDVNSTSANLAELCANTPGLIIQRPHSCNRWIKCPTSNDGSDYAEGTCVMGHFFHKDKQKCAPEKEVACLHTKELANSAEKQTEKANAAFAELPATDPSISILCALRPGSIVLRPHSCNRWIRCPTSVGAVDFEEGACVPGLYFDSNQQTCAPKEQVICSFANEQDKNRVDEVQPSTANTNGTSNLETVAPPTSKHTESSTTATTPTTISTAHAARVKCPYDRHAYRANSADCRKYYICIRGIPILTWCPTGLLWNSKAEYCDLPENVKCN